VRARSPASFRDSAGFVFFEDGKPFRLVNEAYRSHFGALESSGLAAELQDAGLLIRWSNAPFQPEEFPGAIALLEPDRVPFVSYPYEWCFSELKDAALATLEIQRRAIARGMTLKDASAFNIQFFGCKPILIDSLSFEIYEEGKPWQAYRQFCRHFLAPLALMAKVHPEMGRLARPFLDGVPLELASKSLPFLSRFNLGLGLHLHLHAKAERTSSQGNHPNSNRVSRAGMLGLVDSLERTVRGLSWDPKGTVWADYYAETSYSGPAMASKRALVEEFLRDVKGPFGQVWDLGANTGEFSSIAAKYASTVIAWDLDPGAVERHYLALKARGENRILPLLQDLANPSPALGWESRERDALLDRARADAVMALALVHHLAIGNNVPLDKLATFFARLGEILVIEFVPKQDSQAQRLLAAKADIFDGYSRAGFESAFGLPFEILRSEAIPETERVLYLMRRKSVE
jgi:hypothetical protein